jgi:hypothetical protein
LCVATGRNASLFSLDVFFETTTVCATAYTDEGPATCERPAPHERRAQSYDVASARERTATVEVTDAHEVAESRTTTKRSFSTSGPQEGLAAPSSTKKLPFGSRI